MATYRHYLENVICFSPKTFFKNSPKLKIGIFTIVAKLKSALTTFYTSQLTNPIKKSPIFSIIHSY